MASLALKIADITEESLAASHGKAGKLCPSCDPDVPGHVESRFCKTCKGSRRAPLSFLGAFSELEASRRNAMGKATRKPSRIDDEDFLEY
jgi:hypothetical protein